VSGGACHRVSEWSATDIARLRHDRAAAHIMNLVPVASMAISTVSARVPPTPVFYRSSLLGQEHSFIAPSGDVLAPTHRERVPQGDYVARVLRRHGLSKRGEDLAGERLIAADSNLRQCRPSPSRREPAAAPSSSHKISRCLTPAVTPHFDVIVVGPAVALLQRRPPDLPPPARSSARRE